MFRVFSLVLLTVLTYSDLFSQKGQVIDQVLAIVGREVIMESEVEAQAVQMRAQGYYTSGDIKCEVLEELLFSKLLMNQARLDSVTVSDAEVLSESERRLTAYINQIGSEEKLEEYYKKSLDEIRDDLSEVIMEQMTAQRMMQTVTADVVVTPSEIRTFFEGIPKDSLPIVNTQFALENIIVYPEVKEVEILRIKDRLREFKERVTNGESFATLAVLYSEDPGSAPKGGELGFVSRGDLVPEFSAVAFNLQPGEVSKVVKTDYGYHIIQLIEQKGERINCRHILLKPRVALDEKQKTQSKLDSLKTEINAGNLEFKQACWMFSEDDDTRLNGGVMVNPMTGNSKWEASQLDPKVASAIKNLTVGEVSNPFETEDDNGNKVYKIVRLKEKVDPHPANLEVDYQLIQNMATEKKKGDFMKEWMEDIVESTFIKIDDQYKNCAFENKAWVK